MSVIADIAKDVLSSVYEIPSPSFEFTGPSADTSFSGSFVGELSFRSSSPPLEVVKVVLKHSDKRVDKLGVGEGGDVRDRAVKTDRSSVNEVLFLSLYSPSLPPTTPHPTPLYTSTSSSGSTILMSSLSSHSQVPVVPPGSQTDATVKWIANFHAAFMEGMKEGAMKVERLGENGGWEQGTHLEMGKRPSTELENLSSHLKSFMSLFSPLSPYFSSPPALLQPTLLPPSALSASTYLSDPSHRHRTMVHGDYKQGNFFYNPKNEDEVQVIDWQWTGPGLGTTDLVYLCVMALSNETVEDYENQVLRPYHGYLLEALGKGEADYPYGELMTEFKIASLDFHRWLSSSRLPTLTPSKLKASKENVDVNHGIWRRNLGRIEWLWKVVDGVLEEVEDKTLVIE